MQRGVDEPGGHGAHKELAHERMVTWSPLEECHGELKIGRAEPLNEENKGFTRRVAEQCQI